MHIEQTDAGTWRVQVRHGGRRGSGTYPTKREAQRRGAQLLIELGGSPTAITATVGDICADFVADLEVTRSAIRGRRPASAGSWAGAGRAGRPP